MEEARRKLRIWLLFVVALAVVVGCVYYFNDVKSKENNSDGTLVKAQWEDVPESVAYYGGE